MTTVFKMPPRETADPNAPVPPAIPRQVIRGGKSTHTGGPQWPTLGEDAKQGIAWRYVTMMDPHTEADPNAVLFAFLASAGCYFGPGRYVVAGHARHPGKIWPIIAGSTATGAKGTAMATVNVFWHAFDKWFVSNRTAAGLATGEGLIRLVRDPNGDDPDAPGFDEGVNDKRLLVNVSEFAAVMSKMNRDGSILSEVLREAYDDGVLQNPTSGSPLKATGSHIVLTPQITPDELVAKMNAVDAANGFGNRFMLVCSKMSKRLPEGSRPDTDELHEFVHAFEASHRKIERATSGNDREMFRTEAARKLWRDEYNRRFELLADMPESPVKALMARWHANSTRMSVVYALVDGELEIHEQHVRASLACWDYVAASTEYIFGSTSGDRDLGRLVEYVNQANGYVDRNGVPVPPGRSRAMISKDLFQRHKTKEELDLLIEKLMNLGGYEEVKVPSPSGKGRPTILYQRVDLKAV